MSYDEDEVQELEGVVEEEVALDEAEEEESDAPEVKGDEEYE